MKDRLPDAARKGVLIDPANPQPEIRKNAEKAKDWPYAEEAAYLYRMGVLFKDRLIDPLHHLDRDRLPDPIIAFENLRNKNTLAAFRLTRNPEGLLNEIIMNTEHYVSEGGKQVWSFGRWAQLETLTHEEVHEWQQVFGKDPVKVGRVYHNKEFVDKCESLGLHPLLGVGCHTRLADGPFEVLMKELGIESPDLTQRPNDLNIDWFKWLLDYMGKSKKGKSSLTKWTCGCQNIRVGTKDFFGKCTKPECGNVFVRADGLTHTVYKADEK